MLQRPLRWLLCRLGVHGPNWYGSDDTHRSCRTEGFVRTCRDCGAVWHGEQVYGRTMRYLGNWRRVK